MPESLVIKKRSFFDIVNLLHEFDIELKERENYFHTHFTSPIDHEESYFSESWTHKLSLDGTVVGSIDFSNGGLDDSPECRLNIEDEQLFQRLKSVLDQLDREDTAKIIGQENIIRSTNMNIQTWTVPFEAYCGNEPYIFISYSHKDHLEVYEDINHLHRSGYRIWFDEGIDPGNEWAEMVEKYLMDCSLFVVFITENAIKSLNVRNEINLAIDVNKPFIAIHLKQTELRFGLRLRMGSKQAVMKYRMEPDMYHRKLGKVLTEYYSDLEAKLEFTDSEYGHEPVTSSPNHIDFDANVYEEIQKFYRLSNWKAVGELAPDYVDFLLRDKDIAPNPIDLINKLVNLGVYLTDAGYHVSAKKCMDATVEYLLELIKSNGESLSLLDHLGMIYNNLGRLARKTNSTSRSAESFYRKSVEVFNRLYPDLSSDMDLGDRLGMTCNNLGNALSAQAKYEEARYYYQKAIDLYKHILEDNPSNSHIKNRVVETNDLLNEILGK